MVSVKKVYRIELRSQIFINCLGWHFCTSWEQSSGERFPYIDVLRCTKHSSMINWLPSERENVITIAKTQNIQIPTLIQITEHNTDPGLGPGLVVSQHAVVSAMDSGTKTTSSASPPIRRPLRKIQLRLSCRPPTHIPPLHPAPIRSAQTSRHQITTPASTSRANQVPLR